MSTAVTLPGIKRAVKEGRMLSTPGGNTASDLMENKRGRIVSKDKHKIAKALYHDLGACGPKGWIAACRKASDELGYYEVPMKRGSKFHRTALKIYDKKYDAKC